MAIHPTCADIRPLLVACGLFALTACGEPSSSIPKQPELKNGRYLVVNNINTGETIEVDTATGKTWVLNHSSEDRSVVIGWEPIRDLN